MRHGVRSLGFGTFWIIFSKKGGKAHGQAQPLG